MITFRFALVALALFAGACKFGVGTDPSEGELGRAEFAWAKGLGCIFGCDADEAIAVGGNDRLRVENAGSLPDFAVSSSDDTILTFTHSGSTSTIGVSAHRAGDAKVILTDVVSGEVIDRFVVSARDVAQVRLSSPSTHDGRLLVFVGVGFELNFDLLDDDGEDLRGQGVLEYTLSEGVASDHPSVARLTVDAIAEFAAQLIASAIVDSFTGVEEDIELTMPEPAAAVVTATAPSGATLQIPIFSVDEGAITSVSATVDEGRIEADAFVGDERVIGAPCTWSITPDDGTVRLVSSGRSWAVVDVDPGKTGAVTCTINGHVATVPVEHIPAETAD